MHAQSVHHFVGTADAVAWGVPFTESEISEAADLLIDRGYIRAFSTDQLGGLRPRITPDGRTALQSDLLISEYGRPNPTAISYDYSSKVIFRDHAVAGGVISGGQSNTQHVQQTIGADLRSDLADQLAYLIKVADELPEDTPGAQEVRQNLAELENENAKPERRQSVIKDLTLRAMTAGASAVGTSSGQQLIEGLAHLARMLGN